MSTKEYSKAILASYVTYKELYSKEEYRSPYQILAEFIKYILCTEKIYSFSLIELKDRVNKVFEFDLPNAVLKSALKKIDFVIRVSKEKYCIDTDKIKVDNSVKIYKEEAENKNENIINLFLIYAQETLGHKLENREKKELNKEFIAYLIDESNGNKYQDLISTFILINAENEEMTTYFTSVREGGILYAGLNYNIEEVGSITNDLTLYLDMEILFDIYGYNGEVFQQLALDLINLVRDANKKEKKIRLKFFEETKNEIDLFFAKAEDIVTGKVIIRDNVAMKVITNGCNDSTDISDRKSDFYTKLRYTYGITEDEKKSYYDRTDYIANLEGWFREEEKDLDFQSAIKIVSHINKLRNNQKYYEYTKARYIFVTDTWKTIECSKKVVEYLKEENEEYNMVGYAISMSMMTNILWYKLNKGFGGNDFPENVNSLLKAKIVLSNSISQNISQNFQQYKAEYERGELTDRQLAARLIALRERAILPENITVENLDDSLNFDPAYIERFEEDYELQKIKVSEKQIEIEKLLHQIAEANKLKEEQKAQNQKVLNEKDSEIKAKNAEIKEKENELEKYRQQEDKRERKRIYRRKIRKFVLAIIFRVILLIIIGIGSYMIAKYVKADSATTVSIIVTIISTALSFLDIVKNVYTKIFNT